MTFTGDNPHYKYVFHPLDKGWFTHDVTTLDEIEGRDTWFLNVSEEIEYQLEIEVEGTLP